MTLREIVCIFVICLIDGQIGAHSRTFIPLSVIIRKPCCAPISNIRSKESQAAAAAERSNLVLKTGNQATSITLPALGHKRSQYERSSLNLSNQDTLSKLAHNPSQYESSSLNLLSKQAALPKMAHNPSQHESSSLNLLLKQGTLPALAHSPSQLESSSINLLSNQAAVPTLAHNPSQYSSLSLLSNSPVKIDNSLAQSNVNLHSSNLQQVGGSTVTTISQSMTQGEIALPIMESPLQSQPQKDPEALACAMMQCPASDNVGVVCACNFKNGKTVTFKNKCDMQKHNCRFHTDFKMILPDVCPWQFETRSADASKQFEYIDESFFN